MVSALTAAMRELGLFQFCETSVKWYYMSKVIVHAKLRHHLYTGGHRTFKGGLLIRIEKCAPNFVRELKASKSWLEAAHLHAMQGLISNHHDMLILSWIQVVGCYKMTILA